MQGLCVRTMQIPRIRSRWKHKKGNYYTVIQIANSSIKTHDSDFPVIVVYMNDDGDVFARPLDKFLKGNYIEVRDESNFMQNYE